MISPPTGDLQVARRIAFTAEAGVSYQGKRGPVRWHDVGLHAVQAEDLERMTQGEWQGFGHVAPFRVRRPDPVAEVSGLRRTADDLIQVDRTENRAVFVAAQQELLTSPTPRRGKPRGELSRRRTLG